MRSEERSLFEMTPGMRVAIFLATTGISMILGALITFSIVAAYLHVGFTEIQMVLMQPGNGHISLFANAFASLIAFIVPSIAVAFFTKGAMKDNMGFKSIASFKLIQWVVLLAFSGLLLSGALASFTELIPIPVNFKNWANGLEETYKKAMMAMTQMNSIGDLLINLLAVALIPAIVEEIYFRGSLQKTLHDWTGRPMLAILITAIVFSAFHFSYFGFLSRMALGIILGLIYEYTKTIWLPILLHFINNGMAVMVLYRVRGNQHQIDKVMDQNLPIYWLVISLGLVSYILYRLKQASHNERLD
jgi:membrane protease YdiL (CAAX protease family)